MDACRPYKKLISLEMDGEIDVADRERLERHLAACSGCRAEQGLWRRIRSLIPRVGSAEPNGLALRVLDGIRRRKLESERALPLMRRTAAAAAIVIVAAIATLLMIPEKESRGELAPRAHRDLEAALIMGHTNGPTGSLILDEGGDTR
jgi:anti-sigma factor RsiW